MIRPSSIEGFARGALIVIGDFLLGWGALAAVVFIRRRVPILFTHSLLPPTHIGVVTVILFAGAFVAGAVVIASASTPRSSRPA